ncbi:MAG: hypothetical protein QOG58_5275 [Caballeronia sp.]|nr:hypothetical protein [Caballeronia sp.]
MPLVKRVSSRAGPVLRTRPKRGPLVRHGDRIAEVLGEPRGERVKLRSLDAVGIERPSAVKCKHLNCLTINCSSVSPQLSSQAHCHRLHVAGGKPVQRPTGSPRL